VPDRSPWWSVVAALVLGATGAPLGAQQFEFGGQVRPRFEARDPLLGGGSDAFTSMRVRAQMDVAVTSGVRAYVQLQDVRLWGEEEGTLSDFDSDGFDLHQGWVELGDEEGLFRRARVGRQEVIFGGERLIGAVGWAPQARAFDGVVVTAGAGPFLVDLFGLQVAESAADTQLEDGGLVGAYGVWALSDARSLDLYGFVDLVDGEASTREGTFGARYQAESGPWVYRVEASGQLGRRRGRDVSAFMVGVRLGRGFLEQRLRATLWYDILSGDDDPVSGDLNAFRAPYSTGHKFYGFADLFTGIPAQTGDRGLQDIAGKLAFDVVDDWSVGVDVHAFRLAATGGGYPGRLGEEVDLTVTHAYAPGVEVQAGFSHVWDGPALREVGRLAENMYFGYLMLSVAF